MSFGDIASVLTDDRDFEDRSVLDVFQGGNGDWYVSVRAESERLGRSVRISTSGGLGYSAPGLGQAVLDMHTAIACAPQLSVMPIGTARRDQEPAAPDLMGLFAPRAIHMLKSDRKPFADCRSGMKTSEIREDDRGFQVGDGLIIMETEHTSEEMAEGAPLIFTGREFYTRISHIQRGYGLSKSPFGAHEFVALSLSHVRAERNYPLSDRYRLPRSSFPDAEQYRAAATAFELRSWFESDWKDENGGYLNRCGQCEQMFAGYKRRVQCRACAKKAAAAEHFQGAKE